MLNRRNLIRSAAGLLVAAGAGEVPLPERRVWALPNNPLGPVRHDWSGWTVHDFARDPVAYFTWVSEQPRRYQEYVLNTAVPMYYAYGLILDGVKQ